MIPHKIDGPGYIAMAQVTNHGAIGSWPTDVLHAKIKRSVYISVRSDRVKIE